MITLKEAFRVHWPEGDTIAVVRGIEHGKIAVSMEGIFPSPELNPWTRQVYSDKGWYGEADASIILRLQALFASRKAQQRLREHLFDVAYVEEMWEEPHRFFDKLSAACGALVLLQDDKAEIERDFRHYYWWRTLENHWVNGRLGATTVDALLQSVHHAPRVHWPEPHEDVPFDASALQPSLDSYLHTPSPRVPPLTLAVTDHQRDVAVPGTLLEFDAGWAVIYLQDMRRYVLLSLWSGYGHLSKYRDSDPFVVPMLFQRDYSYGFRRPEHGWQLRGDDLLRCRQHCVQHGLQRTVYELVQRVKEDLQWRPPKPEKKFVPGCVRACLSDNCFWHFVPIVHRPAVEELLLGHAWHTLLALKRVNLQSLEEMMVWTAYIGSSPPPSLFGDQP